MKPRIDFQEINGTAVFSFIGNFNVLSDTKDRQISGFKEKLDTYVNSQNQKSVPVKVVIDMEKCCYISPDVLGLFIITLTKIKKARGELKLVNVNEITASYFKITRTVCLFDCTFK